jgi:PadR family transcriptional regulator PadR
MRHIDRAERLTYATRKRSHAWRTCCSGASTRADAPEPIPSTKAAVSRLSAVIRRPKQRAPRTTHVAGRSFNIATMIRAGRPALYKPQASPVMSMRHVWERAHFSRHVAHSRGGVYVRESPIARSPAVSCWIWGRVTSTLSQLRRGVIEGCVLAMLRSGERYGLEIVRELSSTALITSDGTIYPLLARLGRRGLVTTDLRASPYGPARRYYRLTKDGVAALQTFSRCWVSFRDHVDDLLAPPS